MEIGKSIKLKSVYDALHVSQKAIQSKIDTILNETIYDLPKSFITDMDGHRFIYIVKAQPCISPSPKLHIPNTFDTINVWGICLWIDNDHIKICSDVDNVHYVVTPYSDKTFNVISKDMWYMVLDKVPEARISHIDMHRRYVIDIEIGHKGVIINELDNELRTLKRKIQYLKKKIERY